MQDPNPKVLKVKMAITFLEAIDSIGSASWLSCFGHFGGVCSPSEPHQCSRGLEFILTVGRVAMFLVYSTYVT